ncbi:MAG: HAD hydrolase family protein, partial [Myxococcales bacterium]|nr:HAD hydrolase family protein [Myxococcales bacterium]
MATDLDGTLLGGSDEQRTTLRQALVGLGDRAIVIFVTGRSLETVRPLLSDPLVPTPSYIIADVGATIARTPDLCPVQPLQSEIDRRWPGTSVVTKALASFSCLTRQSVPQERRCSFFIDDAGDLTPAICDTVESLGCELLFSLNRYLDVLPSGVSKGKTLRALVDTVGLPIEKLVVCGDTLNDESMYALPCPGIVVGGAEPALAERVATRESVIVSREPGAAG